MKRRITALFLALALLCAILPTALFSASAAETSGTCGENLTWSYNEATKTLTISGSGAMEDFEWNGRPWESFVESIETINLPDSLTSIGDSAFSYCSSLTSVTIPDSVTSIGGSAFYDCSSLTSVTIPDSVTRIGGWEFCGCSSLTSVTIGNSVTSIGRSAFQYCSSLTSVTIPDSVTSIGDYAFDGCSSLTSVTIPDSVTSIGNYAFFGCSSLTSVTIGNSVTSIGKYAFYGCSSLTSATVAEENPNYSSDAYGVLFNKNKTELICCPGGYSGSYTIPDSVTSIGGWAFYGCSSLTSVTIPDSVTSIGDYAFFYCSSLTSAYFCGDAPELDVYVFMLWDELKAEYIAIPGLTLYYIEGKTGWTTPTWNGYPTATWDPNGHVHSYDAVVTAPTCTEKGYTTHTCACGDSYKDTYVNALGHSYTYKVTTTPTTSASGVLTGTCSRCSATTTVTLPKLNTTDYTYSVTKEATCTATGTGRYTWKTTSYGTFYFDVTLAKTAHSYKDTVTAPTCTAQGYTTHTCSSCGDSYKDTYTDALGHDVVTDKATAATCTETGLTEGSHCARCNEVLSKQETVPALGHNYVNGVCSRCGEKDPNYVPPVKPDIEFTDVKTTDWYYSAVNFAVTNNLFNGMGDNKFEPNTAMNRAMLVTVLWRYAGSPKEGTNTFTDVKAGQWYTDAVAWASSNSIVGGVGGGKFDPEGIVTREQMAAILFRYSEWRGFDTGKRADFSAFPDANKVSDWATDAMQWAVAEGLIGGSQEGGKTYILPADGATRAQVATILMRFIQNIAEK